MRYLSPFVLLLCSPLLSTAQQIRPVLQSGHGSRIEFYGVNHDKNLLMTADGNEVMLWNTLSGKQLRRIASPYKIHGASLCSNGEELAIAVYEYGKESALNIYSTRTGEKLAHVSLVENNSWGGRSYPTIDGLITDNKNNRVAIRSFSTITIVDIDQRKKQHQFKLSSYDNGLAFTADPAIFAIAYKENNDAWLALADTTGKSLRSGMIVPSSYPAGLLSDQERNRFYLLDNKAVIHVLDDQLQQVDSVRSDSAETISRYSPVNIHLSADGKKLLVPLHKSHYYYDLEKKQWQRNNWKWINHSTGLLFADGNADKVVKVTDSYSIILDAPTGEELHFLRTKTAGNPNTMFSPSGRMMSSFHASSTSKSTAILDLKTGMHFNETEIDYAIFQWITDSVVLCAPYPTWDSKAGEFVNSVEVRNIYNGKVLHSISLMGNSIDYAAISKDMKKIALVTMKEVFVFSGNGFEKKISYKMPGTSLARNVYFTPDSRRLVLPSEVIRFYDFNDRKWTQLKDTASYSFNQLSFTPDGKEMWYEQYKLFPGTGSSLPEGKQLISVYNFQTGVTSTRKTFDTLAGSIAIHPSDDLYAIGFFNGVIQLRRRSDDQLLYEGKDHNGHVDEIIFAPAKRWMLSRGEDGLIRFMDIDTKEHVVTAAMLYANRERGFALLAPDNAYLVPASFINELHFAKEHDTYSFAQLDLQLNRPDKVLERLGIAEQELLDMHRKAYKRRLNKAGYFNEQVPDISSLKPLRILNRRQIGYTADKGMLELILSTDHASSDIIALNIYINGQKVDEVKGKASSWKIPLSLSAGRNNIEVAYVTASRLESLRERIEVRYTPAQPVHPKTYYIGVAVSAYKDSSMNLKYAVKDVTDIAARFHQKDTATRTYLFTDGQVTRSNLDSIRKLLSTTTINDKVIISFSGHGMLDTAYNFFFATWDMDFAAPAANGISFNDINGLLDNIPARQKLVLIDACHSGEVDRDVVSFTSATSDTQFVKGYARSSIKVKKKNKLQNTVKLMEQYFTDIGKDNGANIISAAAGEEYALESSEWNNGVFSYSFIKGYFEKEADTDHNGKVSQAEIRKYMQQLVLKLTKGKQQPTSRSTNSDHDWEL